MSLTLVWAEEPQSDADACIKSALLEAQSRSMPEAHLDDCTPRRDSVSTAGNLANDQDSSTLLTSINIDETDHNSSSKELQQQVAIDSLVNMLGASEKREGAGQKECGYHPRLKEESCEDEFDQLVQHFQHDRPHINKKEEKSSLENTLKSLVDISRTTYASDLEDEEDSFIDDDYDDVIACEQNIEVGLEDGECEEEVEEDLSVGCPDNRRRRKKMCYPSWPRDPYSMLEDYEDQSFALPVSIYYTATRKGFNSDKLTVPLADVLLGGQIRIRDIFLLARLSEQGKLVTGGQSVGPSEGASQFGNTSENQYLSLLAPMKVIMTAEQSEVSAYISGIYRFFLSDSKKVEAYIGGTLPIRSRLHTLDFNFEEGKLNNPGRAQDTSIRETAVQQFFRDFEDVRDFFIRAVLRDKKIIFEERQRTSGFGDFSLFGLVDLSPEIKRVDGLQFGASLTFPTGKKQNGDRIFEIELGNGGGFLGDVFASVIFNSGNNYFNPALYFTGIFSFPFTCRQRIPKLIVNDKKQKALSVKDLIVPESVATFRGYLVEPFSELDTQARFFADEVRVTKVDRGSQAIIGFGNYIYELFNCDGRLSFFYDFMFKGSDCVLVREGGERDKFDTSFITRNTAQRAHRIGWNLAYKFCCNGEINVGSQHVIAGTNVEKINEVFFTVVGVF